MKAEVEGTPAATHHIHPLNIHSRTTVLTVLKDPAPIVKELREGRSPDKGKSINTVEFDDGISSQIKTTE